MNQLNVRYNLLDANSKKMPALDLAESVRAFEQLVKDIQTKISRSKPSPPAVYISADVKQECVEFSFLIDVTSMAENLLDQYEIATQILEDQVVTLFDDWHEYLDSLFDSRFRDLASVIQPPLSSADIQELANLYKELKGSGVASIKTIKRDGKFVGLKIKARTHDSEFDVTTQNLRLVFLSTIPNIRKNIQALYAPLGKQREYYQNMMLRRGDTEPTVIEAKEYRRFDHTDHMAAIEIETPTAIEGVSLYVTKVVWEGDGKWSFRPEQDVHYLLPDLFSASFSNEALAWRKEYVAGGKELKPGWLLQVNLTKQPTNTRALKKKMTYDYVITSVLSSVNPSEQQLLDL